MSASQGETSKSRNLDASVIQEIIPSSDAEQTVKATAPVEASLPMPTGEDAIMGTMAESQSATSGPQPEEGDHSQISHEPSVGQMGASQTSQYETEIRDLKQRLLQLETRAVRPPRNSKSHKPRSGKEPGKPEDEAVEDDKRLRKLIRKAPYGRRWVEKAEARAEETVEERKQFGKAANNTSQLNPYPTKDTMYHVTKDGTMREGDQLKAMIFDDHDYFMNYGRQFGFFNDAIHRRLDEPHPLRGVRPPFSLRPIYKQPEINSISGVWEERVAPTDWETSDTDEWSSDTSTRSQDFNYYRARLRGDFEWELDRLNAQVRRYKMRHEKKQARLLADRAKEEDDRLVREFEQGGSHKYSMQRPDPTHAKPAGKYGLPSLNIVEWYMFRAARITKSDTSFAIDVLDGEPKISDAQRAMNMKETISAAVHEKTTSGTDKPSPAQDSSVKDSIQWNGQGPLPERIRINSKPIIDSLSKIHGKQLCPQQETRTSVVMLRPFRMLNDYAQDIRDLCVSLADATSPDPAASTSDKPTQSVTDPQQPDSTGKVHQISPNQEPAINSSEKAETTEHLNCLREFIDKYISKKKEYLNSIRCEKIVFSDLWYLFTPGTLVISSNGKQAYRVASLRSKRHKLADPWATYSDSVLKRDKEDERPDIRIKVLFVHFDGRSLGPVSHTFVFNKFDGERDVTSLDIYRLRPHYIYPLRFYILKEINERSLKSADANDVRSHEERLESGIRELQDKLIKRGELFLSAAGVKHMYYAGLTADDREEIESQVMTDFEEAYSAESRKEWRPDVKRLVGTVLDPDSGEQARACDAPCCWQENVHDDTYVETDRNMTFMDNMMADIRDTPHKLPPVTIFPRPLKETKPGVNALTDDELIIMSYSVPGFVLRDRSWAKLQLDNLFEIEHSSSQETETADDDLDEDSQGPFGQLVLPTGYKRMVLSLISQHFRNKESVENKNEQLDIVRGKGKGLIILLHGAPGVGKTTTAEGVAEVFKKPLFQITCGDLGSNPKEVETALQTNFALANRWGCILLLDEADVFLAERRREDFNRNGMVAVFLRVLEYYAGILFLTTNRIGDFDEAFASRIHMSLHYPALDEVSTVKVFRLNLNLIKNRLKDRIKIEEDEIIAAACQHWREKKHARWNGRQIRNACQTALALAEFDAQPKGQKYNIKEKSSTKIYLKLTHLKAVSDAYLEFTEYLKEVHGTDAEGRAKESGLRALDTLIDALKRDKSQNQDVGGRPAGGDDRSAINRSPLHGFKLGSDSHPYQQPSAPPPPSSSTDPHRQSYHPAYYGFQPQPSHQPQEAPFAQGHSMQYPQGPHASSQYLGGPQSTTMPAHVQAPPPGSHLQPPHMYPGGGGQVQGHYQIPQTQAHVHRQDTSTPQPGLHGAGYPSATESTASTGPMTPVSPPYHGGGQSQPTSGGWNTPGQTGQRGPG